MQFRSKNVKRKEGRKMMKAKAKKKKKKKKKLWKMIQNKQKLRGN